MQALVLLCCLLAQEEMPLDAHGEAPVAAAEGHFAPPPMRDQSLLKWWLTALGPFYLLAIFGSGALLFVGGVLVVLLARPPVIAAYLTLVPIPFLIGLFGIFEGMITAFRMIASSTDAPKASEIAEGVSTSLSTGLTGTLVIIPTLLIVGLGLVVRTALSSAAPTASETLVPPPRV